LNTKQDKQYFINYVKDKEMDNKQLLNEVLKFKYDNVGHADYFLSVIDYQRFVYLKGTGWLVRGVTHYATCESEIFNAVVDSVRNRQSLVNQCEHDNKNTMLRECKLTASKVKDILTILKNQLEVKESDFNTLPNHLNFLNGVVNLESGQLIPHDKLNCKFNYCINANYNINANLSFIEDLYSSIIEDAEVMDYLQRAVGYTLSDSTTKEVIFYLYGTGGNGKGMFWESVSNAFRVTDDSSISIITPLPHSAIAKDSTGNALRPDLMLLKGAKMAYIDDLPKGYNLSDGSLKSITGKGNTKVAVRGMRKDITPFSIKAKIWIDSQHNPKIDNADQGAFKRRLKIINFPLEFRSGLLYNPNLVNHRLSDDTIKEKLSTKEVIEAVILYHIQGSVKYFAQGLEDLPEMVNNLDEMFYNGDYFSQWIDESNIAINPLERERYLGKDDLYSSYCLFMNEYSPNSNAMGKATFTTRLKQLGAFTLSGKDSEGKHKRDRVSIRGKQQDILRGIWYKASYPDSSKASPKADEKPYNSSDVPF